MIAQYAPLLRAHLAASRAKGRPFAVAWEAALAAHPVPASEPDITSPWPMKFTREVFRAGYYRLEAFTGGSILAEAS